MGSESAKDPSATEAGPIQSGVVSPSPSFASPPVAEVAVSITFRPLEKLSLLRIVDFYNQHLASHFPVYEEHPPVVPAIERFDTPGPALDLSMFMSSDLPLPRLWFLTKNGEELVQIQRDWFACNWRKTGPHSQYDSWQVRKAAFVRWLGTFSDYAKANDAGDFQVIQCELVYVNHIDVGAVGHSHLERLTVLAGKAKPSLLPDAEQMQLHAQYAMRDEAQNAFGRLHIDIQPGFRREGSKPIYVLTLTVRGRPKGGRLQDAYAFLDRANEWADQGFVAVTTDEIQRFWGRE